MKTVMVEATCLRCSVGICVYTTQHTLVDRSASQSQKPEEAAADEEAVDFFFVFLLWFGWFSAGAAPEELLQASRDDGHHLLLLLRLLLSNNLHGTNIFTFLRLEPKIALARTIVWNLTFSLFENYL